MMAKRHERRVRSAARRAGVTDERGACDDWIMNWLRRCRREAARAGHELEEVNTWTMDGIVEGREEVQHESATR